MRLPEFPKINELNGTNQSQNKSIHQVVPRYQEKSSNLTLIKSNNSDGHFNSQYIINCLLYDAACLGKTPLNWGQFNLGK